jgi:DNA-binding CsgD family transcriptional regulator
LFAARARVFEAALRAREGNASEAEELLDKARDAIERSAARPLRVMVDTAASIVLHHCGADRNRLAEHLDALPEHDQVRTAIETTLLLGQGAAGDALERIGEALAHESSAFARRLLLGLAGSVAVLGDAPLPPQMSGRIRDEARGALSAGRAHWFLPILSAAAALETDREIADKMMARALLIARVPVEPLTYWIPSVLVIAAAKTKNEKLLHAFAHRLLPHDRLAWTVANYALAEILAARALGSAPDLRLIDETRDAFVRLDAPFFASLVRLGLAGAPSPRERDPSKLTRRERQVAEYIAAGSTNREIAERLVLSERTVEGHVANIFNKLNVGSRSAVAAWYVGAQTSTPALT